MQSRFTQTGTRKAAVLFAAFVLVMSLMSVYALAAVDEGMNNQDDAILPASGVWGTCPWEIDEEGTLTVHPGTGADTDGISPWSEYNHYITRVVFATSVTAEVVVAPSNCSGLLYEFDRMKFLDLSSLDTSNVTDMDHMFYHCVSLTSLDLSSLDTSNVTDMASMFSGCSSLTYLDFSSLDTSNVTDMDHMFFDCTSLTSLNLSSLDTSCVTDMEYMFHFCTSLTSLDLSSFDTAQVESVMGMFACCSSLTSLDLSSFDTSQVKSMRSMFATCSSLVSLDLSSFGTTQAEDMSYMFTNCSSLGALDLSSFDTSNVTDMRHMFFGCASLLSLDISHFVTKRETNVSNIFYGCSTLSSITLSADASEIQMPDTNVNGHKDWYSSLERKWFTAREINAYRRGIADVYTKYETRISIEGFDFSINQSQFLFDGTEKLPSIVIKDGNKVLVEGVDYAVTLPEGIVNVGEYDVIIKGIGDYAGEKKLTFEITPAPIVSISLDSAKLTYDGTHKKPAIAVKAGDAVLLEGVDYEVSYPDIPVAVGTYTATITGKGNYSGTKTISYEIVPAAITSIALDATKYTHDGTQKRPSVTVKCGARTLAAGSDYTVTYPISSSAVGTYTVTVAGKGNYTGTKQATFEIVEASKPTPDEPKPDDPGAVGPKPDEPKPDDPGAIDPKPDDPGTQPDNPGTTDPDPGNPDTQPEGPGTTDPQPDDPGTVAPEPVATQVMYRAYNPNSGEHFYTASYGEVEGIVAAGWQYEGEAWTAPVTSAVPVYRLYSGTDHHYTTSAYERDELLKVGWSDEGIGWYSDEAMGVGLHRLFNPNVDPNAPRNNSGSHHYTTSDEERDHLVSIGWRYEDYGWYGVR